jgi:hypothetical protein
VLSTIFLSFFCCFLLSLDLASAIVDDFSCFLEGASSRALNTTLLKDTWLPAFLYLNEEWLVKLWFRLSLGHGAVFHSLLPIQGVKALAPP